MRVLPDLDTVASPMVGGVHVADAGPCERRPLRVAVVDEGLPYPPNSGKRIRTLNLLLPLAARHHIAYLAYPSADPDETRQAVAFLRSHSIETVLAGRPLPVNAGPAFLGRLLRNLLSPLPYSVQIHNAAAMRRAIRQYAAAHAVDLWQAEWTPYAESLRCAVGGPWLIMAHNVESLIWQRYSATETNRLKRWYINRQWHKFERFERRVFSQTARTIAVSDADAELAASQFCAHCVSVVENGVDTASFRHDGSVRDHRQILFLGSLDWRPNLDAVAVLLDQVFPEVLALEPSARLAIVGRKPPRWIADRVRGCSNVELHADVPDVRPFLWRAGVMVVPLRIGGGSRLKILEALAAECPVVSTKIGAEGLCLEPGRHFVQCDPLDKLAASLVECIRDPRPTGEIAKLGREVVVARYDWSALAEKLNAVWLEHATAPRQPT